MEISKSLQEEIRAVQNKLKNAIQNHQVYVGKLSGDPNNEGILGQLHEIQEHIISLSKCQKQVVQRLRKEVKLYEAANTNGIKVSIGSLLGLNNNNHITNNNERTKSNDSAELITVNGNNFNGLSSRRCSKDDYEDEIKNVVDPSSPSQDCDNNCPKGRTRFDELNSNEDAAREGEGEGEEDVIEINTDNNSVRKIKTSVASPAAAPAPATVANDDDDDDDDGTCESIELCEQLDFLGSLGLITSDKHDELQNKRAERKRRSTANPQFVYSNWEIPTKRKRHSYLQSNGTAPQTRQTTARLNGPSPPPSKAGNLKPPSPPSRTAIKSLIIPTQKSSTRPNILRNNSESKLFSGKIKSDNCLTKSQQQQPISAINKPVQSLGNKAVRIPGLPSSLTIERIENDSSAVCIHCRNPGSLTVCEICEANFHVSCHAAGVLSTSQKFCPKCYMKTKERDRDRDAGTSSAMVTEFKREDDIEEKGRDRYDLRERNSDLRLQVYELEKRSQLLGQSLQQQHRTRQELLGKQEKTQRSIKRLVDFIKLMKTQKNESQSHQPLASTSFHLPPSSSPLPRIPSPHAPVPLPPQSTSFSQKVLPQSQSAQLTESQTLGHLVHRFSSINSLRPRELEPSPIARRRSLTPTNCQSPVYSRKNHRSHTSSLKRSPNHYHHHHQQQQQQQQQSLEQLRHLEEVSSFRSLRMLSDVSQKGEDVQLPRSLTINSSHPPVTTIMINQRSNLSPRSPRSPIPSSPESCRENLSGITERRSPEEKMRRQNHRVNPILIKEEVEEVVEVEEVAEVEEEQEEETDEERESFSKSLTLVRSDLHRGIRTASYHSTVLLTAPMPSTSLTSLRSLREESRSGSPVPCPTPNQRQIYSTHCSQAITSPIPSPVVSSNRKIQPPPSPPPPPTPTPTPTPPPHPLPLPSPSNKPSQSSISSHGKSGGIRNAPSQSLDLILPHAQVSQNT